MKVFRRVDVLINNAGILRDKSFNKMGQRGLVAAWEQTGKFLDRAAEKEGVELAM